MILVRDVYRAKYGRGSELVALLKEFGAALRSETGKQYPQRILSDASGPFFTIVEEIDVPSLAEWEALSRRMFSSTEFQAWFKRWLELVDSGSREFYNTEK
jgi:hypothetical protein